MKNKVLLASSALFFVLAGVWLFIALYPEPEPEPEPEVDRPMTEKEQIELMMRIGYIQQEDLEEIPDEEPEPE